MSYFFVSVAYTAANFLLSIIVFVKSSKNQITRFYFFCVLCLVTFGVGAFSLSLPLETRFKQIIEQAILFIYTLFPFLFIHFILYFARKGDLIKSLKASTGIYLTGLFAYAMILLNYIPRPISGDGTIPPNGYVFYLTWMSIFFSIGIAMLFEINRKFTKNVKKSNIIFLYSASLLFILPGPLIDSILFGALKLNAEWYFYLCTFALVITIYVIFRHKIIVNTMYDALKLALEVMNDLFITMDRNFRIEIIQGNLLLKSTGYSKEELIGQRFDEFIDQKNYLDEYRTDIIQKKMKESYFDANILCKDNKKISMNFSLTPIFEDEQVSGFVSVGRNITERKMLEEQFRQAQKFESVGTLASGIAHDFNNLLQIILLNTNVLKKIPIDDSRITKVIDVNTEAVNRGAKLIHQILTFARKTDVQFKPMELSVLIEELKKFFLETFPRTIVVEVSMESEIPPIYADPNQISQVLINLCINARDAIPEGGGSILIKCEILVGGDINKMFSDAKEDRYVCISVTDTGSGMSENVRGRIFEPFFTTKEKSRGTGLGLAVVYGIVTAHKGFIDVKSNVGVGTTFYVYLPVMKHIQPPSNKYIESQGAISGGSETVLLVEDEDTILQSISALLKSYGYKIITAIDGYKALEAFQEHKSEISLIILDIGLPKKSGLDVCQEIREMDNDIKVIIATGYLDPKINSEKLMTTVNGFVPKPYDPDQLLRTIRKVLDEETESVKRMKTVNR